MDRMSSIMSQLQLAPTHSIGSLSGSRHSRLRRNGPIPKSQQRQSKSDAFRKTAATGKKSASVANTEPIVVDTNINGATTDHSSAPPTTAGEVDVLVLPPETSIDGAIASLKRKLESMQSSSNNKASGLIRLEVSIPRGCKALWWLQGQQAATAGNQGPVPVQVYFSPRRSSAAETEGSSKARSGSAGCGSVAGLGAAWLWRGKTGEPFAEDVITNMQRFLVGGTSKIRVFGGARFDSSQEPSSEWHEFGSYCFVLPRIEFTEASGGNILACTVAWDETATPSELPLNIEYNSFKAAIRDAKKALDTLKPPATPSLGAFNIKQVNDGYNNTKSTKQQMPDAEGWADQMEQVYPQLQHIVGEGYDEFGLDSMLKVNPEAAKEEYLLNGQQGLDELLAALDGGFEGLSTRDSSSSSSEEDTANSLAKIVLARRTDLTLQGRLNPLALLEVLQGRDPRAYQVYLQMPSGTSFMASTPECLYTRSGDAVASEAVAGTRARGAGGDVEKDFWLSFDLLRSGKDHVEFCLVRDWVEQALGTVCCDVQVEVSKSVLKQGNVQHLYGKLAGRLHPGKHDADLLAALHPTPAVCGQPRGLAMKTLQTTETFDRGFYAGPFGWMAQDAAEFVVAIRSALIRPEYTNTSLVSLYAGVGIVSGSDTSSEWAELELKVMQYERLLARTPVSLHEAPNIQALWARLTVEELCRLGCTTFCIAPGSRSSPLTLAIAQHPNTRIVSCIDERSLCFWALGHGRATGRPAVVVTSSGTAVANLLPGVVEASQSGVPLILLTADRPSELRDTGANQTINQVGIFGTYTRWDADIQPPTEDVQARVVLTTVDTAYQKACLGDFPGPVHLNCQYREPLAPSEKPWNSQACLAGLTNWQQHGRPFTTHTSSISTLSSGKSSNIQAIIDTMRQANRGLIVVGEMMTPDDAAAAIQLGQTLGWPIASDVLSSLRVGAVTPSGRPVALLSHFDHLLLNKQHWNDLQPNVVIQLGGHLTSKRTAQFLEACALTTTKWVYIDKTPARHDQSHLLAWRVQSSVASFVGALDGAVNEGLFTRHYHQSAYTELLVTLDIEARRAIDEELCKTDQLTEPHVARLLSQQLPPGEGLFLGNSMPIRDFDMYAATLSSPEALDFPVASVSTQSQQFSGLGAAVAANRGASGIDGVLSTAAGFADGLQRGCTLVVGDISFLHDINGLHLLRNGEMRSPLTVVLINNGGGAIFSFLPIAEELPEDIFTPLWATPQHVDLAGMCRAHGIPHIKVVAKEDLQQALSSAWALNRHSVVEVVTDRHSNVDWHKQIQASVQTRVSAALNVLKPAIAARLDHWSRYYYDPRLASGDRDMLLSRIILATYKLFELPLSKPLTTNEPGEVRRGVYIVLRLSAFGTESAGIGEVSPLPGLHMESYEEALEQTALICHLLEHNSTAVPFTVMALEGRLGEWLSQSCGLSLDALYPSVRFGLECAVIRALTGFSKNADVSFKQLLSRPFGDKIGVKPDIIPRVNGLIASATPEEAVEEAKTLVEAHEYEALKIKVGRKSVSDDVAVVCAVRAAVGSLIVLRADANRKWTMEQAIEFANGVKSMDLQYIEEPLANPSIWKLSELYQTTGMKIALDESLQQEGVVDMNQPLPQGISAVVLKPSVLGGIERTLSIASWATHNGSNDVKVVISSAFESAIGISLLELIAHGVDPGCTTYHGLATLDWFNDPEQIEQSIITEITSNNTPDLSTTAYRRVTATVAGVEYGINMACVSSPIKSSSPKSPIVFLHGFMGSSDEWTGHMAALASTGRCCFALDIPGHGESTVSCTITDPKVVEQAYSLEAVADAIAQVLTKSNLTGCSLVGYSLGGRLALLLATRHPGIAHKVTIISGTPGIQGSQAREDRRRMDDRLADALVRGGIVAFVRRWYRHPMWASLRGHPNFKELAAKRSRQGDAIELSRALAGMSPGRAPSLWKELEEGAAHGTLPRLTLIAGELDTKFVGILKRLESTVNGAASNGVENKIATCVVLPGCGHAVHIEQPMQLLPLLGDDGDV